MTNFEALVEAFTEGTDYGHPSRKRGIKLEEPSYKANSNAKKNWVVMHNHGKPIRYRRNK
jgi:hypothetical protein